MTATATDTRAVRPAPDEFAPYYGRYIERVPDGDIVATLRDQVEETLRTLRAIPDARAGHRYAPDKWSIREVTGHLADAERVFAYRAMTFARADVGPVPGFDENAWVPAAESDRQPFSALIDLYATTRAATLSLLRTLEGGRPIMLTPGEELRIVTGNAPGRAGVVSTTFEGLAKAVHPGDHLLLSDGTIELVDSGGYTGLNDIANHPAKGAIQYAVSERLVDGYSDKLFRPDQNIKRGELAQYLVMGVSARQQLPLSNVASFTDVPTTSTLYAYAQSAVSAGAPLRDLSQKQASEAYSLAEQHETNPRSIWGYVQGLTRLSQRTPWQDGRYVVDRAASRLLTTVH